MSITTYEKLCIYQEFKNNSCMLMIFDTVSKKYYRKELDELSCKNITLLSLNSFRVALDLCIKKEPNFLLTYQIIDDVLKLSFDCREHLNQYTFNLNLVEKKINFEVSIDELVKKSQEVDIKTLLTKMYDEINFEMEIIMKMNDYLKNDNVNNTIKKLETSKNEIKKCLNTLVGHTKSIISVACSSDSQFIVSGSSDQTIKIWDTKTGQCLKTFVGHTDWVHSVCFSPDGQFIVYGSFDKSIKIWDAKTNQCLKTLVGNIKKIKLKNI